MKAFESFEWLRWEGSDMTRGRIQTGLAIASCRKPHLPHAQQHFLARTPGTLNCPVNPKAFIKSYSKDF